jgi:NAD(P)-dependent dehydrogenase (short-subunit alcohol dehydrogenase family)
MPSTTPPHALVVGGTRGSGRAVVRKFAALGAHVSVIGRRDAPEKERALPNVKHYSVDLRNAEARRKAMHDIFKERKNLSQLILLQRFRGEGDAWADELEVSLTATKEFIEGLTDRFDSDGAIVVVGSVAARYVASEQPVAYHAAKAALLQMVRYYAVSLGAKGIRVNSVSPASVLKEESKDFYLKNEELMAFYRRILPLGRIPTAEEIANVVAFLCSSEASAITGQDLIVDGGLSVLAHEALARGVSDFSKLSFTRRGSE